MKMRLLWFFGLLVIISPSAAAQGTVIAACDDQVSWCDLEGQTVPPGPEQISQQCELFPNSCSQGKPLELADSGCVEDSWRNFCTDQGKLRDPTPSELENLNLGISGESGP
jgi:hypothetical protein